MQFYQKLLKTGTSHISKLHNKINISVICQPDLNLEALRIQDLSNDAYTHYLILLPTKHLHKGNSYSSDEFKSLLLLDVKAFDVQEKGFTDT